MVVRALFVSLLLAGCQMVPPEERAQTCANTDWERFGMNDGRIGVQVSDRVDQFTDCTELGAAPDMTAYHAGRTEGLAVYCTAESGYEEGYKGRGYGEVCPPTLEPDFLQGYKQGRKERPVTITPRIGIGIGSGGGVRTGIGIGLWSDRWDRWRW